MPHRITPRRRRILRWLIPPALVVIVVVVGVAGMLATGTRLFVVETPSMGTAAPVGSLVVVRPSSTYATGDVIAFVTDDRVFTHRVIGSDAAGLRTQGDVNGAPDPGSRSAESVIGRAIAVAPGLGYLTKSLPWLVLGAAAVEGLARLARRRSTWSESVRILGAAVVLAALSVALHPWFGAQLIDYRATDDGQGALMHVVNTGLLPVAVGGEHLSSGQDATVLATDRGGSGAYTLSVSAAPDAWQVAVGIAVCLLPLIVATFPSWAPSVSVRRRRAGGPGAPAAAVAVAVAVAITAGGSVPDSQAAFTASLSGSATTVGTNSAFTCRQAVENHSPGDVFAAYALATPGTTTESDLSGNGRTATFSATSVASAATGCLRDTPASSVAFDGTSQCLIVPDKVSSPNTFSLEAWFRTSHASNGRILGFGNTLTVTGDNYADRIVYIDPEGRVVFGIYPNNVVALASPDARSYADGEWHAVVATLSSAGMALYLDGVQVDSDPRFTWAQSYDGYWKVGCGNVAYWSNGGGIGNYDYTGPPRFTGDIQYPAVYTRALTADEVRQHYLAGR